MAEMNAALGVAQMRRLDEIIQKRQRVAGMYMARLMDSHDIVLPTVSELTHMSWFVFVVRLANSYTREERDRVIAGLTRHDIGDNRFTTRRSVATRHRAGERISGCGEPFTPFNRERHVEHVITVGGRRGDHRDRLNTGVEQHRMHQTVRPRGCV